MVWDYTGYEQSVYVIDSNIGLFKVGISIDPMSRMRNIERELGITCTMRYYTQPHYVGHIVERIVHKLLKPQQLRIRTDREWFHAPAEYVIEIVRSTYVACKDYAEVDVLSLTDEQRAVRAEILKEQARKAYLAKCKRRGQKHDLWPSAFGMRGPKNW